MKVNTHRFVESCCAPVRSSKYFVYLYRITTAVESSGIVEPRSSTGSCLPYRLSYTHVSEWVTFWCYFTVYSVHDGSPSLLRRLFSCRKKEAGYFLVLFSVLCSCMMALRRCCALSFLAERRRMAYRIHRNSAHRCPQARSQAASTMT